jgi:hypothetical protein
VGAEAYAFNEFGNQIHMTKPAAPLSSVTVTLSSWACQTGAWYSQDCVTKSGATFTEPITLNLYNPPASMSATPGSLIKSVTHTFTIPYRPSASTRCTGAQAGEWYAGSQGCFNGKAHNVTFNFQGLKLPQDVVYGISYNTTDYGPSPYGPTTACHATTAGCPYDSLNIALSEDPTNMTAGSNPNPGTVFQNSPLPSEYCDGGAAGVGVFRLDSPTNACWSVGATGPPWYVPAVQFTEG